MPAISCCIPGTHILYLVEDTAETLAAHIVHALYCFLRGRCRSLQNYSNNGATAVQTNIEEMLLCGGTHLSRPFEVIGVTFTIPGRENFIKPDKIASIIDTSVQLLQ